MTSMTRDKALRKSAHYDKDAPRCCNCAHYRKGYRWLLNSLPRKAPPLCKLHVFNVVPNACCDNWTDAAGTTLDDEP